MANCLRHFWWKTELDEQEYCKRCDDVNGNDDVAKSEKTISKYINETLFWLIRAKLCIKLNDYKSAIDRLERAKHSMDWIYISWVYNL